MKTNDRKITDLMATVHSGKTQLPDFQRGWVWDDNRIKALIASITNGYPVGAAMFLEYGNDNIRFKYRVIEAIISFPENRKITSDFGRKVDLDVSSDDLEYEQKLFPLNIILDPNKYAKWQMGFMQYYNYDPNASMLYTEFLTKVIVPIGQYTIPVITLDKDTPKEAVCQVFENVNTGGVSLTVFELVTAVFAMDDFELRKDWEDRKQKYFNGDILSVVSATDFLTACTLLSSYINKAANNNVVSCKKKDVLNLTLGKYEQYANALSEGFVEAEKILQEERIFSSKDLPYSTQLIPLAVLCTLLSENNRIKITSVKDKIKQWYWCGVFGEMYGSANETRYVYDVVGVMTWLDDPEILPRTIQESYFNPGRLLSLQSRLSAAYKGVMALILKNHCRDFISGREMDFSAYKAENIDIHHIFPRDYCEKQGFHRAKWNSVVNKTPISYSTNREIGGVAPSVYLKRIEQKGQVAPEVLASYLETHFIDVTSCRKDDLKRAYVILNSIEMATGKAVPGRDSEETILAFGGTLKRI